MSEKPSRRREPQMILILRAAGGGYLIYLAWSLWEPAFSGDGIHFLIAMVVFALIGAALLFTSGRLLAKGEFLRPWENPDQALEEDEPFDEELEDQESDPSDDPL